MRVFKAQFDYKRFLLSLYHAHYLFSCLGYSSHSSIPYLLIFKSTHIMLTRLCSVEIIRSADKLATDKLIFTTLMISTITQQADISTNFSAYKVILFNVCQKACS